MALREVVFLLDAAGAVLWADASTSPDALPDSRERWLQVWRVRAQLAEVAHSHPEGPLAFSAEDESTMSAIEAALGRRLTWSVVTPDAVLRRKEDGTHSLVAPPPAWVTALRLASGLGRPPG